MADIVSEHARKSTIKIGDFVTAVQGISLYGKENTRAFAVELIRTCERPVLLSMGDGVSWKLASMRTSKVNECERLEYEALITTDKIAFQLKTIDRKKLEIEQSLRVIDSSISSMLLVLGQQHQQYGNQEHDHYRHPHQHQHLNEFAHHKHNQYQQERLQEQQRVRQLELEYRKQKKRKKQQQYHKQIFTDVATDINATQNLADFPVETAINPFDALSMLSEQSELLGPIKLDNEVSNYIFHFILY